MATNAHSLTRSADEPATAKRTTAWVVVGLILAAATIGWGAYSLLALLAHAEHTEQRTIASAGVTSMRISTSDGNITVTTVDAASPITVETHTSAGLHAPSAKVRTDGAEVSLSGDCSIWSQYWCSVSYRVQVPAGIDVVLRTDNGDITVDGTAGSLSIRADTGTVRATNLDSPTVTSRTDAGSTRLQFRSPPVSVDARTDLGSVTIVVPDGDTVYNVSLANDLGSQSNRVRHDPSSGRTITARADLGDVTVRYPD